MGFSDYPRDVVNWRWLWWFPAFDAFPIALALPVALLSPRRRFPVSLLVLPSPPFPRCFPALRAAISLLRPLWTKTLFAAFQQAAPRPPPAPPSLLLFGLACKTLGRAHGS